MNQRPSSHLKPPTVGDSNIGAHIQNMDVVTPKHIQTNTIRINLRVMRTCFLIARQTCAEGP